jgi:hypothetical protein
MIIKLELTQEEVEVILAALGRLPYGEVYQLISKVVKTTKEQMNDQFTVNGQPVHIQVEPKSTVTEK